MAITKGIVAGGNYTFSAANQTVTFSSDYLGMSLSDITYITNIASGVATVIYDPFDPTKGGTLSGLVLTLAYNTVAMSDSDPLQIIVGFTPSTATPQNVSVAPNSQLESQTELLQSIAESTDLLSKVVDRAEGIEVNIRDINPPKRDVNNAQIISDGVQYSKTLIGLFDQLIIDTSGYQSVEWSMTGLPGSSMAVNPEVSADRINWTFFPYYEYNSTNTTTGPGSGYTIGAGSTRRYIASALTKYMRVRIVSYTSGAATVTATLKQTPLPTGPFTQLPVNMVGINGGTPTIVSGIINTGQGTSWSGLSVGGSTFNNHGSTTVTNPVIGGGREAPLAGSLGGIIRTFLTDPQGRYILGGDYDGTRPRDPVTGVATGPNNTAPIRGVGGRPNTMMGSQALLVQDVGQSEGDDTTSLLQQILVELKMLNQQINELPLTMNLGIKMQNEVGDYRQEEYNNHVNNQ